MEYTNVYKFEFYYDNCDEDAYERFVVAETEEEAWDKINNHFEMMHREGYARPVRICDPTVAFYGAII